MISSQPVAIEARSWAWRHAGRRAWAVRELSFRIEPGERVLLLGASGSGKSTLLAGLAGVLGGDDDGECAGSLTLDGMEPAAARGRAGLLLQDPESQTVLARVGDDVAFACENLAVPREKIWPRVQDALDAVRLRLPLAHPTNALSGGQKQRLALAGMLAMQPGLLLLDEPTANLDPDGVIEIRDAVERTVEATGATLVVVEHRVAVWQDLVDRIIVLDAAGGLLADGRPDDVLVRQAEPLSRSGVWLPGRSSAVRAGGVPGEVLLRTDRLRVARPNGPTIPLEDVVVREGTASAVTGRNGSGKSTFALTLGGLIAPRSGRVSAAPILAKKAGDDPFRWSPARLLTRIGSVFQNPEHQILGASVRADLAIGPRALGLGDADIRARVDEMLQRLRLDTLAEANPFTLSGGQKRRLSVATAIVTEPRVLVLDEPTFGQDALTWRELVDLLADLRDNGHAVIAATHDSDFVRALDAEVIALSGAGADDPAGRDGVRR